MSWAKIVAWMGIIQNLLEKGFSAFYKKISFLPQSFSTKEISAYEPDASDKYHYDGSGYPGQQICGNQIPIEAQILGLMDAYYAMTSQRPYRPAPMTPAQAFQTLLNESGTKWNPNLVASLFGLMP